MGRLGAAALASLLAVAAAGPAAAQSVFEACDAEIAARCADVQPGGGRLVACLYAHEDKLSESCDAAVADVADLLDLFFERVRYAKQQCLPDITKLCADVDLGGGRLISCLKDNAASLSPECGAVVSEMPAPQQ